MQHLVFVYGTLRRGESATTIFFLNCSISRSCMRHRCRIYALYDLGDYPALSVEVTNAIFGEVYLIDDDKYARALDQLEDVPVEYRREIIDYTFWSSVVLYCIKTLKKS